MKILRYLCCLLFVALLTPKSKAAAPSTSATNVVQFVLQDFTTVNVTNRKVVISPGVYPYSNTGAVMTADTRLYTVTNGSFTVSNLFARQYRVELLPPPKPTIFWIEVANSNNVQNAGDILIAAPEDAASAYTRQQIDNLITNQAAGYGYVTTNTLNAVTNILWETSSHTNHGHPGSSITNLGSIAYSNAVDYVWTGNAFGLEFSLDGQTNKIGKGSQAYAAGVAVGFNAVGLDTGTALGSSAVASYGGVVVGFAADGRTNGTGVGLRAYGKGQGNIALGYNAEANPGGSFSNTVEIGEGTATDDGWLHYRGVPLFGPTGILRSNRIADGSISTNKMDAAAFAVFVSGSVSNLSYLTNNPGLWHSTNGYASIVRLGSEVNYLSNNLIDYLQPSSANLDYWSSVSSTVLTRATNNPALWHTTNGYAPLTAVQGATNNPALWHTTNGYAPATYVNSVSNDIMLYLQDNMQPLSVNLDRWSSVSTGAYASAIYNRVQYGSQNLSNWSTLSTNLLISVGNNGPTGIATNNGTGYNTALFFTNSAWGTNNVISQDGNYSLIAGGRSNWIYDAAFADTISGGYSNFISDSISGSTIAGGLSNSIVHYSHGGAIGGGQGNRIGETSVYTPNHATIAGGLNNGALGARSAIGGGQGNLINSATGAGTIPGGFSNLVYGDYAFAAGRQALASNNGAFVWSDSTGGANWFSSRVPDSFIVRASGGVGINTNNPGGNALRVLGNVEATSFTMGGAVTMGVGTNSIEASGNIVASSFSRGGTSGPVTLLGGANIVVSGNSNNSVFTIATGGAVGEANNVTNLATQSATVQGLAKTKAGVDIPLRSLQAGSGIAFDSNANTLTIRATNLNAAYLTNTLPDAVFPATLPVASGNNLTSLRGDNLLAGTVNSNALDAPSLALIGSGGTNIYSPLDYIKQNAARVISRQRTNCTGIWTNNYFWAVGTYPQCWISD